MKLAKWMSGVAVLALAGGSLTACGNSNAAGGSAGNSSNSANNSASNTSSSTTNNTSNTSNAATSNSSNTSNSSSSSGGGSGSGTSGQTGPLTLTVAAPFSGNESFIGPRFLNGVKVAVKQINQDGGVLGHKFRVVTTDTAGDPVDAVPAITQNISTTHPVAMIGPSSLTITSVDHTLNQDKLVDVTLGGTTQLDKMNFKYIFRTTPSDSQMGVAMAYYGIHKGYKKAALVFGSNSSAQTLVAPVANTLKKHATKVVQNIKIVPDQSSYRSEIERILKSKPDVLFIQFDPQTASTFFSEWQQLGGGKVPVIGSDVTSSSDFIKAIGSKEAANVLTSIRGSTAGGKAATQYASFYKKMYGKQPIALSNNAYDAVNMIALSMLEAKSTKSSDYVSYMTQVADKPGTKVYDFKSAETAIKAGKKINYEGATGPDDFNQYHNVTGAFQAVQPSASGNVKTVSSITAQNLLGY